MPSEKSILADTVQQFMRQSDWKSAIAAMEKLFELDPDPIIQVRIGDLWQKLGNKTEAVPRYIAAADIYADKGFVVKALAQYKLALRLDPDNQDALSKMDLLHSNSTISGLKLEPLDDDDLQPTRSVIPLFADLTTEEFSAFTKHMTLRTYAAKERIVGEGDIGRSVYLLTRGSVRIFTTVGTGRQVDLAILHPSDFFGEIAYLTGKPRTATVVALEESDVLEISDFALNDLITRHPRIKGVLHKYHEERAFQTITQIQKLK